MGYFEWGEGGILGFESRWVCFVKVGPGGGVRLSGRGKEEVRS